MLTEKKLISQLQRAFPKYIGDDAAVVPFGKASLVVSKDILVEDVHFRRRYFTAEDLAIKALQVNCSDMAAMGVRPSYIASALALPPTCMAFGEATLNALVTACQQNSIELIGGDLTASTNKMMLSITIMGYAADDHIRYRSGACAGDKVVVIGNLGIAGHGLQQLESGCVACQDSINAFLRPQAKIEEGYWCARQSSVTSMMDISDSLYLDLGKLCAASKCGAVIDVQHIEPHLPTYITWQDALVGGEDYGLLCTVKASDVQILAADFMRQFGYKLKVVGHITTGHDVLLKAGHENRTLSKQPFQHFGE